LPFSILLVFFPFAEWYDAVFGCQLLEDGPMRRAMWMALAGVMTSFALVAAQTPDDAILERMKKDIFHLASDELQGRGVETKGNFLAGDYIAKQFADAGLKPGGPKGEWFQSFEIAGGAKLDGVNTLTLRGPESKESSLKIGKEFQVMGVTGSGKASGELFFAGFGITVKDDKKFSYDDFKDADVKGKVVVVLRHTPRWNVTDKEKAFPNKDENAGLDRKVAQAATHKAAAVIVVNDLAEAKTDDLLTFEYLASASQVAIPVAQVKRSVIDEVFRSALNMSLEEIEKKIGEDLKPQSQPLKGWSVAIETHTKRTAIPARNVVGVLEGNGPLAKETVVLGAHYDHLGMGGRGSREKGGGKGQIHHGADDNASGTTTLIELARRFGGMKERQGRRLVFLAFSGEELGLLGSRHYTNKEPLFPLESTVGMVNLDMVGRSTEDPKTKKEKLTIHGSGTAKGLDKLLEKTNPGFQISLKPEGTGPSDHDSFFRKSIPVVFFFSGFHDDYHKPSDTADKINIPAMKKIADYAQAITADFASEATRPVFVKAEGKPTPSGGGKGPRLGIMPDYDEAKNGLLVGGVTPGGAASKAGVKDGDLIVEIGGRPVTNISTYMAIMGDQKAGQPVEIGLMREGKKLKLQVTPQ